MKIAINPLNAELNPICHLLTLLEAHHILHVSRIRVKTYIERRDIENCNAGNDWRVGVRMATRAVRQAFGSNRVTHCQQCRQSDCIINLIISVHLHCPHHIIYNFASIRYISLALTLRRLMSYIYAAPILDVSRSHKTMQHSR